MTFSIVLFVDDDEVAVVCSKWLTSSTTCVWPPASNKNFINRFLRMEAEAQADWVTYTVRILFTAISKFVWHFRICSFIFETPAHFEISETYDKAKLKEKKAAEASDLESSDIEGPRRSKPGIKQLGNTQIHKLPN